MIGLLLRLLGFLILGYVGLVGLLYFFQEKMLFFPQKLSSQNRERLSDYQFEIEHQGVRLHGWFVNRGISEETPLIIYYGGNGEEISHNLLLDAFWEEHSFLMVNYRGYGDSEGVPSQTNLFQDALFLLDHIAQQESIPLEHIILMGRSLGSGVAVHVAKHRMVKAIILITPFDSVKNVAQHHYPFVPVSPLLKHPFDSVALAPEIDIPLLGIIGTNDQIIANSFSHNLIDAWKGPKQLVTIPGASHNDISLHAPYWEAIHEFINP